MRTLVSMTTKVLLTSATALLWAGCLGADGKSDDANANDDAVVAEDPARWSDPRNIPVCFVNSDGNDALAQQMRSLVESEYAKVGLCFSGWQRCTANMACPTIRAYVGKPSVGAQGAAGQSYVGTWQPCGADAYTHWSLWVASDSIDWATIHEFGHAIGLEHEQGRTDNPGSCAQQEGDIHPADADTTYYTIYDPDSVMNYCSGRNRLSSADIDGIKKYYGTSGPAVCGGGGTKLVAPNGKCLDVSEASTADGAKIQLWTCNGSGAQSFRVEDRGNGTYRFVNTHSNKCVDVSNSGKADGTQVQLWTCNGSGAQSFKREDTGGGYYRFVNTNSGTCLDINGGGSADGTKIQIWGCNSSDAQRWKLQ